MFNNANRGKLSVTRNIAEPESEGQCIRQQWRNRC